MSIPIFQFVTFFVMDWLCDTTRWEDPEKDSPRSKSKTSSREPGKILAKVHRQHSERKGNKPERSRR